MAKRKTRVTEPVRKLSYKEALGLYMEDERAFRSEYTRQRDQAKKQLERLQKSGGAKARIAKDFLEGIGPNKRGKILKLSELAAEIPKGLTKEQAARYYAHALMNVNYVIFSPRASLTGWKGILQRIRKKLQENGYGDISKSQLELMGEIMARVYSIFGRKFAPSEEVMEAIAAGMGDEMKRMTDDQLKDFIKKWDLRRHPEHKGRWDNDDMY